MADGHAHYDDALVALYRAPRESFVAERKRLVAQLKSHDRSAAARLAKVQRPTASVWVVNQLWWTARPRFEQLFALAAQLRAGDRGAAVRHRESLVALRSLAVELLAAAGHAASDATVRKIGTNLSALSARGGFDPDLPGALTVDRDPPGFEAMGLSSGMPPAAEPHRGREQVVAAPNLRLLAPLKGVAALPSERTARAPERDGVAESPGGTKEQRVANEQRTDAQAHSGRAQRAAEQVRIAKEQLAAEQVRAAKEQRAAAQARVAEQQRIAQERRIAEQRRIVEQQRAAEQQRRAEAARAQRLREQRRLQGELQRAQRAAQTQSAAVERLRSELTDAEAALLEAAARVRELESALSELGREQERSP